ALPKPETGGVAETGNEINSNELTKGMKGDPAPDKREPWQRRKDDDRELEAIQAQIKRLKADDANWDSTLSRETQVSIVWLREHKPDGWEARVKEMEVNQKNYVRSQLKPEAQAKLRLLNKRVEEIKHAD